MSAITSTPIGMEPKDATTFGRLFFLDLSGGRILSANLDGSDLKTIISEGRKLPDGLALDVGTGHIYWTNMGDPKRNDGDHAVRSQWQEPGHHHFAWWHVHPEAAPTGEEVRQNLLVGPKACA